MTAVERIGLCVPRGKNSEPFHAWVKDSKPSLENSLVTCNIAVFTQLALIESEGHE